MFARAFVGYLSRLTFARAVLWCYLLWYLVIATRHFDGTPRLWLTSLGLSLIVGLALLLNAGWSPAARSESSETPAPAPLDRWQTIRFFLMPFCVSSFSALVKGKGFLLIFSPHPPDLAAGIGICTGFLLAVAAARRVAPKFGVATLQV